MSRFTHPAKKTSSAAPGVGKWLAQVDGIETLWPSLQRQTALQADVDLFCTQHQCRPSVVRQLNASELVWLAKSPSHAAKLRNLQASLLAFLTQRGWHCNRITVRVQSAHFFYSTAPAKPPKPGLNAAHLQHWQQLAEQLPAGTLQNAVAQLLKRRR